MRFDWFDASEVQNDSVIGALLAGFYRANQYHYEEPIDRGVGRNAAVIRNLPKQLRGSGGGFERIGRRARRLVKAAVREFYVFGRYIIARLGIRKA